MAEAAFRPAGYRGRAAFECMDGRKGRQEPWTRLPGKQPAQGQVADKASQNHGYQVQ